MGWYRTRPAGHAVKRKVDVSYRFSFNRVGIAPRCETFIAQMFCDSRRLEILTEDQCRQQDTHPLQMVRSQA